MHTRRGRPVGAVFLICFAVLILGEQAGAQTVVRLESATPVVGPGEDFTIDVYLDNPTATPIGGYQIAFGFDTARYELQGPPAPGPDSVLTDFFTGNAPPPHGAGFPNCPAWQDDQSLDVVLGLGRAIELPDGYTGSGHLFGVTFRAIADAGPPDLFEIVAPGFGKLAGCPLFLTLLVDPEGNTNTIQMDLFDGLVEISDAPRPTGLMCHRTSDSVVLTWQNGGTYDAVNVYRDGEVLAGGLAGATVTFEDPDPVPGQEHAYGVAGVIGGAETPRATCTATTIPEVAPVTDLICNVSAATVELTWINGSATYSGLEIQRDGATIALLPGTDVVFIDDQPPATGLITYAVIAQEGAFTSEPTSCLTSLETPVFLRGDVDRDGGLSLADGLTSLNHLFLDVPVECQDAVDFNDDGGLTLPDCLGILNFVFLPGSPAPAPPYPESGVDSTDDSLLCEP